MRFHKSMTIEEIYQIHPQAKQILTYFHINGCEQCQVDPNDTLETIAEKFSIPTEALLESLNKLTD